MHRRASRSLFRCLSAFIIIVNPLLPKPSIHLLIAFFLLSRSCTMPPSRFAVSPYKNATPTLPSTRSEWYQSPANLSSAGDVAPTLLSASSTHLVTTTSQLGGLAIVDIRRKDTKERSKKEEGAKFDEIMFAGVGKIEALEVRDGEEQGSSVIAVGGASGQVSWI